MFKEDFGGKPEKLDLAPQHSGELLLVDGQKQAPSAFGLAGQGSPAAPPLFETGGRCSVQITATAGSPLAGVPAQDYIDPSRRSVCRFDVAQIQHSRLRAAVAHHLVTNAGRR